MLAIDINNKVKMVRGDTAVIEFTVDDYQLQPGDQVKFTVRPNMSREEEPSILKIITEFTENGTALIVLGEEDTMNLNATNYFYEIEVRLSDGTIDTVITANQFTLIADL